MLALLAAAVGGTAMGLTSWLGVAPGGATAGALLILWGLPATGGPVGIVLLPDALRISATVLPSSAALEAVRRLLYFPQAGVAGLVWLLVGWVCIAVLAVGAAGGRRHPGDAAVPVGLARVGG